jgi:hypothetical protein
MDQVVANELTNPWSDQPINIVKRSSPTYDEPDIQETFCHQTDFEHQTGCLGIEEP